MKEEMKRERVKAEKYKKKCIQLISINDFLKKSMHQTSDSSQIKLESGKGSIESIEI